MGNDVDETKVQGLRGRGFRTLCSIGNLFDLSIPETANLYSCGVYAITIPEGYTPSFIGPAQARANKNVLSPLPVEVLRAKWVPEVDVVYIGLAGRNSDRTLCERLGDLRRHGLGRTTKKGPHKGGEILWQLVGYKDFLVWYLPTDPPPEPRDTEAELIHSFREGTGRLPFANRQR